VKGEGRFDIHLFPFQLPTPLTVVREATPFASVFDIQMVTDAKVWDHTFDGGRITPRTNNPYRNPEPSVQVVHCVYPAPLGGETLLVDGLKVADVMRGRDPEAFAALSSHDALYSLTKPGEAHLEDRGPVIVVDGSSKRVKSVRFNPRSLECFDAPYAAQRDCYRGLRVFAEIASELAVSFKLGTHDAVIVDNTRILHGREGFRNAETAARLLRGAFLDLDAIQAKHRRLAARTRTQPA
jgi:alpha-ketoglutarate-dependent taurine dioxygenase